MRISTQAMKFNTFVESSQTAAKNLIHENAISGSLLDEINIQSGILGISDTTEIFVAGISFPPSDRDNRRFILCATAV